MATALSKTGKWKIIRDSIHGYIEAPEIVYKEIIDTPIFQRLRQIEQTSMRALYPSAHHNRFVHSLGVYHLGQLAYKGLISNIMGSPLYQDHEGFWKTYGECFQLACLLHDCAHAPMSHSFEFGYLDYQDPSDCEEKKKRLKYSVIPESDAGRSDNKDLYVQTATDIDSYFSNPKKIAPHEMASALLTAEFFGKAGNLKRILDAQLETDCTELQMKEYIIFMQRAIIGLRYSVLVKDNGTPNLETSFKNCLIDLLNGTFFDVDKLDYIIRDTRESGANNLTIDIPRILNALTLVETHLFKTETGVNDFVLNNSVYFTGFNNHITDPSDMIDCECQLNLRAAKLDGEFQGTLEFGNDFAYLKRPESEGNVNGMQQFSKATKITAEISKTCKMTGRFNGKIELLNRSSDEQVDGVIAAKISGNIKGKIIGNITTVASNITTYEIGYDKNVLSVIEDTLIARNRLYLWIYAHHKVTYNDYVLRHGILYSFLTEKDNVLDPLAKKRAASKALSDAMDIDNVFFRDHNSPYYLLSDGDFIHLMKQSMVRGQENHFAEEWIGRRHMHPVWKSYVEYNSFFSNLSLKQRKRMWKMLFNSTGEDNINDLPVEANTEEYQNSILNSLQLLPSDSAGEDGRSCNYVWIKPAGIKIKEMDMSNVYIKLSDDSIRRFKDVISQEKVSEQYVDESFFYLYTSEKLDSDQKLQLISSLKKKVLE